MDIVQQLEHLCPGIDPLYARHCASYYDEDALERILEKIYTANHGYYPRLSQDDAQVGKINTASLNNFLETINELFPNVQVAQIRDAITSQEHTHLVRSVESLVATQSRDAQRCVLGKVYPNEKFRNGDYILAAESMLSNDFLKVPRSSIRAVMAEHNNDYLSSREAIKDMSNKRWWTPMIALFRLRRKTLTVPANSELQEELLQLNLMQKQLDFDRDGLLAQETNEKQYDQLSECGCCFGDYTLEQMIACPAGHLICKMCIVSIMKEATYGQGQPESHLTCTSIEGCCAIYSEEALSTSIPYEVKKAYDDVVATRQIESSGLNVVCCSQCGYLEFIDISWKSVQLNMIIVIAFLPLLSVFAAPLLLLLLLAYISRQLVVTHGQIPCIAQRVRDITRKITLEKRGPIFKCQSAHCGRQTCVHCNKEFNPFHRCYEEETDGMRLHIEAAMANAVKRTCPNCNLSFVKSDGCNKLVCRCGYAMCYICRKDIGEESYRHFCDHFRDPDIESCTICNKCELYRVPDQEAAIREAARRAKCEWVTRQSLQMAGIKINMDAMHGSDMGWASWYAMFEESALKWIIGTLVN